MVQWYVAEPDLNAFLDEAGLLCPEAVLNLVSDDSDQVPMEIQIEDELRARLAFKAQEPIPERLRIANIRNLPRLRDGGNHHRS
jgi:hypothetical protein